MTGGEQRRGTQLAEGALKQSLFENKWQLCLVWSGSSSRRTALKVTGAPGIVFSAGNGFTEAMLIKTTAPSAAKLSLWGKEGWRSRAVPQEIQEQLQESKREWEKWPQQWTWPYVQWPTRAGIQEAVWATKCLKDAFRQHCSRPLRSLPSISIKPGPIRPKVPNYPLLVPQPV